MTITRRSFLQSATAAGALAALSSPAWARTARWDLADEYGAQVVSGLASAHFIDELKKKVGDKIEITYQGSGALGYKSADQFDAVQDGAVQSAVTLVTQLGGIDPIFDLSSLPFMASTPEEAYMLWKAARPEYEKVFADNDMVLLWAIPNPPSGMVAKMPIKSMDALKNLRIRTYDKNGTDTFIKAGASPLQVSWSDLIPQISTGGLDAVLTSADGARQLSLWDYLSDYTELNYAMGLFMCHVNKDSFDSLPDDVQQAMLDLREPCDEQNWKIMSATIENAYKIMQDKGMTITRAADVPEDVFASLQKDAEDVKADWLKRTGDRGQAVLDRFEKMKAAAKA